MGRGPHAVYFHLFKNFPHTCLLWKQEGADIVYMPILYPGTLSEKVLNVHALTWVWKDWLGGHNT